jgi:hypothetical protein
MAEKPQAPTEPRSDLDLLDESEPFDPEGKPVSPQVQAWVEKAYSHWLEFPNAWRTTPRLSSLAAAREIVDEARRYGTKVREVPVTVQVRDYLDETDGGARIVYRVRDKVQSGRKPNLSPNLSK